MVAFSSIFNGEPNESSTTLIIVSDQVPSFRNFRIVPNAVILFFAVIIDFPKFCFYAPEL
jgi:hypothetical protein